MKKFVALAIIQLFSGAFAFERPSIVKEALEKNKPIYYFGVGSNMLREKIENRAVDGSKIEILEMEPAIVPHHRLAFNMRGFIPLEPAMGSLEPIQSSSSKPLAPYDKPECHGALVLLSAENYEKVMKSEGVPSNTTSGYEEIVVTAIPYDDEKSPVSAIALRARPASRMAHDSCPSQRYMNLLRQGAAELSLKPCYQEYLQRHPVQQTPSFLKLCAVYNMIFTYMIGVLLNKRGFSRFQNRFLQHIYVPSISPVWKVWLSHAALTAFLMPGALLGFIMHFSSKQLGLWKFPTFLDRMFQIIQPAHDSNPSEKTGNDTNATAQKAAAVNS